MSLRHAAHQSGTEKSPAFQCECRGFSDGGSLPGAAPPCGGASEASGSVSRPPAPGKSPNRGEFSTFCGSCCGKWKHPYGMPPIKAEQKTPRHSRASAGDFSMGAVCLVQCALLQRRSGNKRGDKPDQLTPVLSAGTVMGRAGCVKSRSVQTFPHFAGRPVENRGRPGDRKNRLSPWNSRF